MFRFLPSVPSEDTSLWCPLDPANSFAKIHLCSASGDSNSEEEKTLDLEIPDVIDRETTWFWDPSMAAIPKTCVAET